MNRINALQWVCHNTHSAHENELEEDVDFLAENSGDHDSQYNFVIDRFLVNEPGNDILEDDEQPILFMNYSVRGRRLPPFWSLKLPVKAMEEQSIETTNLKI